MESFVVSDEPFGPKDNNEKTIHEISPKTKLLSNSDYKLDDLGHRRHSILSTVESYLNKAKSNVAFKSNLDRLDVLLQLLPSRIIQYHLNSSTKLEDLLPITHHFEAAMLFADISDFSSLAEGLLKEMEHHGAAAESLSCYVGASFEKMVAIIVDNGGDVVKFAGDAVMAVFPAEKFAGSLIEATLRCCKVAKDLSARTFNITKPSNIRNRSESFYLRNLSSTDDAVEEHHISGKVGKVSLHCGVSCGMVTSYHIGGIENRWEYVIAGDVVADTVQAEAFAKPMETIVSNKLFQIMGNRVKVRHVRDRMFLLVDVISSDLPAPVNPISGELKLLALNDEAKRIRMETILTSYVPPPALLSIDKGNAIWSGEIRMCSILFCNFREKNRSGWAPSEDTVQLAFDVVQRHAIQLEGTLLRLSVDDKGTNVLTVFGLPPCKHENDEARALRVGFSILKDLRRLSHSEGGHHDICCSIGITTGEVFCGTIGGNLRCEYTVHGVQVNLAARLMMALESGSIACDYETMRKTADCTEFLGPYYMDFKGKTEKIKVYRPVKMRSFTLPVWTRIVQPIFGREKEKEELSLLLSSLLSPEQPTSGVIIIEGEAGVGKTALCKYAIHKMQSGRNRDKFVVVTARGDETDRYTPFYPWKAIVSQLFNLFERDRVSRLADLSQDEVVEMISSRFSFRNFEDSESAIQLVAHVLPDTILSRLSLNEERATLPSIALDNLSRLLEDMVLKASQELNCSGIGRYHVMTPVCLVIVVEDLQWVDPYSVETLYRIETHIKSMGMIISSRPSSLADRAQVNAQEEKVERWYPVDEKMINWYIKLCSHTLTKRIKLRRLNVGDIRECILHWAKANRVENRLVETVFEKSKGHPFIASELFHLMLHKGFCIVDETKFCSIVSPFVGESFQCLPNTISDLVTSKLDRIPKSDQIVLKLASVIGREFSKPTLAALILASAAESAECIYKSDDPGHRLKRISFRAHWNNGIEKSQSLSKYPSDSESYEHIAPSIRSRAMYASLFSTSKGSENSIEKGVGSGSFTGDLMDVNSHLNEIIKNLVTYGFLVETIVADSSTYQFSSVLVQESVYRSLLVKTRKRIHMHLATVYEEKHEAYLQPWYMQIANHYYSAERFDRALEYLEKAGEDALKIQSMQNVWLCFTRLLVVHQLGQNQVSSYRHASWLRKLAEANKFFGLRDASRNNVFMGLCVLDNSSTNSSKRENVDYEHPDRIKRLAFPRMSFAAAGKICNRDLRNLNSYFLKRITQEDEFGALGTSDLAAILLERSRLLNLLADLEDGCPGALSNRLRVEALTIAKVIYENILGMGTFPCDSDFGIEIEDVSDLGNHQTETDKEKIRKSEIRDYLVLCYSNICVHCIKQGSTKDCQKAFAYALVVERYLGLVRDSFVKAQLLFNLGAYSLLSGNLIKAGDLLQRSTWSYHFLELHHHMIESGRMQLTLYLLRETCTESPENLIKSFPGELRNERGILGLYACALVFFSRYESTEIVLSQIFKLPTECFSKAAYTDDVASPLRESKAIEGTVAFASLQLRRYRRLVSSLQAAHAAVGFLTTNSDFEVSLFFPIFMIFQIHMRIWSYIKLDSICSSALGSKSIDRKTRHDYLQSQTDDVENIKPSVSTAETGNFENRLSVSLNSVHFKEEMQDWGESNSLFDVGSWSKVLKPVFRLLRQYEAKFPILKPYILYCKAVYISIRAKRLSKKSQSLFQDAVDNAEKCGLYRLRHISALHVAVGEKNKVAVENLSLYFDELETDYEKYWALDELLFLRMSN